MKRINSFSSLLLPCPCKDVAGQEAERRRARVQIDSSNGKHAFIHSL